MGICVSKSSSHAEFDIVVIGASLGGSDPLRSILSILPHGFPAAIAIVRHQSVSSNGYILGILARSTRLPVRHAEDGQALEPSRVYLAPPGRQLRIGRDRRSYLSHGPWINNASPAIDPLFISAAETLGPRSLGIILSGRLWDGAIGSGRIRLAGGVVIAQDPDTCVAPSMPRAAIAAGADFILQPERIGSALVSLVMDPCVAALFGVGRHRLAAEAASPGWRGHPGYATFER